MVNDKVIKSNLNVFEITIKPKELNIKLRELEKPGLTQEYLKECKEVARLYKKSER